MNQPADEMHTPHTIEYPGRSTEMAEEPCDEMRRYQGRGLLDRLINTSHQVLMDGPSYRPRKRPGRTPDTT